MNNDSAAILLNRSFTSKKQIVMAALICLFAALFYMYEYILQVSPGVMTNELMHDLKLNAVTLGATVSFYYYSYMPMQLPAGLLLDRFGTRRLMTCAILVCALGAWLFASAHTATLAASGRFLMGIGSAFSFISALLLIARWFPAKYFALLAGIIQFMSSLGAIAGTAPLAAAISTWGWRTTMLSLSLLGVAIAGGVYAIVRDHPKITAKKYSKPSRKRNEWHSLRQICHKSQTWLLGLYSLLIWAPITSFAALWGLPFLRMQYGLDRTTASTAITMIWLGVGLGSPLFGWWSDKIKKRCTPLTCSALLGVISLFLLIYNTHLSLFMLYVLLFVFGLAASGQALSFSLVKDNHSTEVVGTAIGFNNMSALVGSALFQPLVGLLLYLNWNGITSQGVPIYQATDYQQALCILPLCYVGSAIISQFLLRETHCRPCV